MIQGIPHGEPQCVEANGIKITYDTFGYASAPALLAISGWSMPMLSWDQEFCEQLAVRGYYVIRFDNRDVGQSTKLDDKGVPELAALVARWLKGAAEHAPYALADMAADAVGLLDALGIERAHAMGISMGGAIAQEMAIHHPTRVRTLTSISSSTGNPDLPANSSVVALLAKPVPTDRLAYIEHWASVARVLNASDSTFDESFARERAARFFDYGVHPDGGVRQLAAIGASGDRRPGLRKVAVPTLVIHGDMDPLSPVDCATDTAASIPGAKLLIIKGMGHALPESIWPQLLDAISQHAV